MTSLTVPLKHGRCHFALIVMYSPDAKFEEHCFNIYRDILDSVLF